MAITILHFDPFRYNPNRFAQRYVVTNWAGSVSALVWDGGSIGRRQRGRGTSPQGWSLRGDGAPNNSGFGLRTSDMMTPVAPRAGSLAECFAYTRGGDGSATAILSQYGEVDGSKMHLSITVNSSNKIVATNGDGDIIGTSTYDFPLGTNTTTPAYTHVEIIPYIHPTLGWVKVYADGVLVLGLQNKNTTNALASDTAIGIMYRFLSFSRQFTDYVVHNAGGHLATYAAAERLGDVRAEAFAPTVAGSHTSGTAVGAASRLLATNDLEHTNDINNAYDDDDTYVELDDTGLTKGLSFTTAAMPATARTVYCVAPLALIRKDNAGTNTGRLTLKSGSTETDGTSDSVADYVPTTDYKMIGRIAMVDPATSAAWLIPAVDAAEIGYERVT